MIYKYILIPLIISLLAGCVTTGSPVTTPQPTAEYKCWDGTIVFNAGQCPAQPSPEPISVCWDGSHVSDLSQCPAQVAAQIYVCYDGGYVDEVSNCPRTETGLILEAFSWDNPRITKALPPLFDAPNTEKKYPISRDYFVKDERSLPSLLDVFKKLDAVLRSTNPTYENYAVYSYKNGFAILTNDELITKKGEIRLDKFLDRLEDDQKNKYPIISLSALNPEDRFRYFAFIVSPGEKLSSPITATPESLNTILNIGGVSDQLPKEILKEHAFNRDYSVQVRVYEYLTPNVLIASDQERDKIIQDEKDKGFRPYSFGFHRRKSNLLQKLIGSNNINPGDT